MEIGPNASPIVENRAVQQDELTMKLIETLQDEHVLIDQVLGSFRAYVDGLVGGTADPDDGRRFAAFFTEFAGHFHHDREEGVLFKALVTDAELPGASGPVHALVREHAEMAGWLREMMPFLEQRPQSADDRDRLRAMAIRYSHALWRHIDAENSVLYPEGEERLGRCGIHELPDRPMSQAEAGARQESARLLARYPPVEDPSLTRGDGCFMCRARGATCDGLEAAWWTELEWEEFFMR
jgi:hemerythrin-like domain-containing protein